MMSRTWFNCPASAAGPLLVEPNHSMFHVAQSNVAAVPCAGTVNDSSSLWESGSGPAGSDPPHADAVTMNARAKHRWSRRAS